MLFSSFDSEKTRTSHFVGQREHWKSHSRDIPKAPQSKTKKENNTSTFKYWGEAFGAHKYGLLITEDTWPPDGK